MSESADLLPYNINLIDWGDAESGDVVCRHGEYLGRWVSDPEGHPFFVPDGQTQPLFWDWALGRFCGHIKEWADLSADERQIRIAERPDDAGNSGWIEVSAKLFG